MRKIRRSLLGSTSFQVALICNWLNDQGIRLMTVVTKLHKHSKNGCKIKLGCVVA